MGTGTKSNQKHLFFNKTNEVQYKHIYATSGLQNVVFHKGKVSHERDSHEGFYCIFNANKGEHSNNFCVNLMRFPTNYVQLMSAFPSDITFLLHFQILEFFVSILDFPTK